MHKILAKEKGDVLLIDHLKNVANEVLRIKDILIKDKIFDKTNGYISSLYDAALFHDIGKATYFFQGDILKNILGVPYSKIEPRHNEIGFAFMTKYTSVSPLVCKLIYWHHKLHNNDFAKLDIDEILKDVDISLMLEIVKELKPNILLNKPKVGIKSPHFYSSYEDENNGGSEFDDSQFMIALSYLIMADRSISGYDGNIESMLNKKMVGKPHNPYNNERFGKQLEISKNINETLCVNAPAGFGKTLTGLLWSLESNKKLIWVCPRIFIAESVYSSINKELKNLKLNLATQLIHGDELKDSTNSNELFNADIIVINIDTYLKYMFRRENIFILMNILNSDVVFDEYHELVSEIPIFSSFIKIMKARMRCSKGRTMLLSASPINLGELLDDEIVYLPSKNTHYEPVHNKQYDIKVVNDYVDSEIGENTLRIKNSVTLAQNLCVNLKHNKLIHSKFIKKNRKLIYDDLMNLYGKNTNDILKTGYIGTHIIQASLDISSKYLIEDVLSPMSTVQRWGRCDRFGDIDGSSSVIINLDKSKSNVIITKILYDEELKNLWFNFLKERVGDKITLSELYKLYNEFQVDYKSKIDYFVLSLYKKSNESLKNNVYPKKTYEGKDKVKNMKIGKNVMRSDDNQIYITCKYDDKDEYIEPMTQTVYNGKYGKTFNEDGCTEDQIKKFIEEQFNDKNSKFDFSKYKDKPKNNKLFHLDNIRYNAKYEITPYFLPNFKYNETIGLYKENSNDELQLVD